MFREIIETRQKKKETKTARQMSGRTETKHEQTFNLLRGEYKGVYAKCLANAIVEAADRGGLENVIGEDMQDQLPALNNNHEFANLVESGDVKLSTASSRYILAMAVANNAIDTISPVLLAELVRLNPRIPAVWYLSNHERDLALVLERSLGRATAAQINEIETRLAEHPAGGPAVLRACHQRAAVFAKLVSKMDRIPRAVRTNLLSRLL